MSFIMDSHGNFVRHDAVTNPSNEETVKAGKGSSLGEITVGGKNIVTSSLVTFLNKKLKEIENNNNNKDDIKFKEDLIKLGIKKLEFKTLFFGLISYGSSVKDIQKVYEFVVSHTCIEKMDPNFPRFNLELVKEIVEKKFNSFSRGFHILKDKVEFTIDNEKQLDNLGKCFFETGMARGKKIEELNKLYVTLKKNKKCKVTLSKEEAYTLAGFPNPETKIWKKNFNSVMELLTTPEDMELLTTPEDKESKKRKANTESNRNEAIERYEHIPRKVKSGFSSVMQELEEKPFVAYANLKSDECLKDLKIVKKGSDQVFELEFYDFESKSRFCKDHHFSLIGESLKVVLNPLDTLKILGLSQISKDDYTLMDKLVKLEEKKRELIETIPYYRVLPLKNKNFEKNLNQLYRLQLPGFKKLTIEESDEGAVLKLVFNTDRHLKHFLKSLEIGRENDYIKTCINENEHSVILTINGSNKQLAKLELKPIDDSKL